MQDWQALCRHVVHVRMEVKLHDDYGADVT